ncbi:MAG TPA: hypothetical protein VF559_08520 [Caulobacteraceae bacterium]|jgi:hypothetical protein
MSLAYNLAPAPEPRVQLAVLRFGELWKILHAGTPFGRFYERESAIWAAGRLARDAELQGHKVELLVQDPTGEVRRWSTAFA